MATCVVTYKNGREQYIDIDPDAYDEVRCGYTDDGYFTIMVRIGKNISYLARIRSEAINGYYFLNATCGSYSIED